MKTLRRCQALQQTRPTPRLSLREHSLQRRARQPLCSWRRSVRSAAETESYKELDDLDYATLRKVNLVQPVPGAMSQTLWRSFIIGGIGLHSGETSFVRVRPAFAGEGRYFVRVPDGTVKPHYSAYLDEEVRIYPDPETQLDVDAEVYRSELFLKYLQYREREGFMGGFREFLDRYVEMKGLDLKEGKDLKPREDPISRSTSDVVIPATLESLAAEAPLYETSLTNGRGDRVESVEHLLAALEACGVDNARIEIEGGPEVPVVDGSSLGWAIEIEQAGVTVAECEDGEFYLRGAMKPKEVIRVQEGDAFVVLIPGETMQLTYGIDHSDECPIIGSQWASWNLQQHGDFKQSLAAARTYVPQAADLHAMRDQGFMKGGSEKVVAIGEGEDWVEEDLLTYGCDDPVRHKLLDLIGDLALLGEGGMSGLPFGHIIAHKADHAMHHAFAKKIKEKYDDRYCAYHPQAEESSEGVGPDEGPSVATPDSGT